MPAGQPQMTAAPAPLAAAPRRRSSGRWLNVVLAVAAAIAIGGIAFAVGRGTASASTASTTGRGGFANGANGANGNGRPFGSFAPGANGGGAFRGGFGGGITVSGTVESVAADSITIKTTSGQEITIGTGTNTTYNTQAPASASDVTAGKTVQVQLGFNGARGGGANGGANGGAPAASGAPAGPLGTASSITVVP
jgi:hypothetical protein